MSRSIIIQSVWKNWLVGTIDSLEFEAKVCDVASEYGADNGRVIKLVIYNANPDRELVVYDRGWELYPDPVYENMLDDLLNYCAGLPKAEDWRLSEGNITNAKGDLDHDH